jgi:hypothetical protein
MRTVSSHERTLTYNYIHRAQQFMGGNGGGLSEMMQNPEMMER